MSGIDEQLERAKVLTNLDCSSVFEQVLFQRTGEVGYLGSVQPHGLRGRGVELVSVELRRAALVLLLGVIGHAVVLTKEGGLKK